MRILVNAMAASTGGALSILKDFYNCVKVNDKENEWVFLVSENHIQSTNKITVIVKEKKTWFNRMYVDFIGWRKIVKHISPDCIFSLQNTIYFSCNLPQVLYVHQPLPFQKEKKFSFLKKEERIYAIYQYIIGYFIKLSIRNSAKVVVQTEWMYKEISKLTNTNKIYEIQPSIDTVDQYLDNIEWNSANFIYPTSNVIYKNNKMLCEVCKELNKRNKKYTLELTVLTLDDNIENVNLIGKINRNDLIKKYRGGTLVFPSYIETFGLPLLEARMMGTLILAADTVFAREILDGYDNAYFFNPFNSQELFELMENVIDKKIVKKDVNLQKVGQENSWLEVLKIIKNSVI